MSIKAEINKILPNFYISPTEPMIADYFAKPLQGMLFYKFRDAIMGIDQNDLELYQRNFDEVIKKYEQLKREAEAAAAADSTHALSTSSGSG